MSPAGIAVVTGASSGIGAEFARTLARSGRSVLAVGRDLARLDALREELRLEGAPGRIDVCHVDVRDAAATRDVAAQARALGGAALLVNCAGVFRLGTFADTPPHELTTIVRVNCEAPILMARELLDQLRANGGRVINVASLAAFFPAPSFGVYAASKALLVSWSQALGMEFATYGVGVTVVCPGPTTTPIFERGAPGRARVRVSHELEPGQVVRAALRGAEARQAVVVPGVMNALVAIVARSLPLCALRALAGVAAAPYLGYGRAPSPGDEDPRGPPP